MKNLIRTAAIVAALALAGPADAKCHTKACHQRVYMKHTIRPYIPWLRATGHCEGANYPGGDSLRAGLRAYSSAGPYMGRYQFDQRSWNGAGGYGDPRDASWLVQAYRAVKWRNINGVRSWPVCG